MESVMQRCTRVICRVQAMALMLGSVFWEDVSRMDAIADEDMIDAVDLNAAGAAVVSTLIDAVKEAAGDGDAPEEMPLPFESLEAMDDNALRDWLIAKIEAKAGKEFFYE